MKVTNLVCCMDVRPSLDQRSHSGVCILNDGTMQRRVPILWDQMSIPPEHVRSRCKRGEEDYCEPQEGHLSHAGNSLCLLPPARGAPSIHFLPSLTALSGSMDTATHRVRVFFCVRSLSRTPRTAGTLAPPGLLHLLNVAAPINHPSRT